MFEDRTYTDRFPRRRQPFRKAASTLDTLPVAAVSDPANFVSSIPAINFEACIFQPPFLPFLAWSGVASSRPVMIEESVTGSIKSQDDSSNTVFIIGTQASNIPDEGACSSIAESSTSAPTSAHPRDPRGQLTITHSQESPVQSKPSEGPSPKTCMSLYKQLSQHDPRMFDLAKCPVNGKSVMRDAILRCQAENPLAPEEDRAKLEKQVQEFFQAMLDDCEKGRRLLKDHLPLRNALYSLGGLIAVGGAAYSCECRKCLRRQFEKYVKRHTSKVADVPLPRYHDGNSDGSSSESDLHSSDDESLPDQPV
jgi:hypothetical protein